MFVLLRRLSLSSVSAPQPHRGTPPEASAIFRSIAQSGKARLCISRWPTRQLRPTPGLDRPRCMSSAPRSIRVGGPRVRLPDTSSKLRLKFLLPRNAEHSGQLRLRKVCPPMRPAEASHRQQAMPSRLRDSAHEIVGNNSTASVDPGPCSGLLKTRRGEASRAPSSC